MMQPISSDFPDPIPRHSAIIPDLQVRAVLYERHERSSRHGMERRTKQELYVGQDFSDKSSAGALRERNANAQGPDCTAAFACRISLFPGSDGFCLRVRTLTRCLHCSRRRRGARWIQSVHSDSASRARRNRRMIAVRPRSSAASFTFSVTSISSLDRSLCQSSRATFSGFKRRGRLRST
jgi:hypothetical protein